MAVPNEKLLLSKNYVLKSPASKLLQRLVAEESLLTKLEHNDDSPVPSGVEHVAKQIADRRIAKHKDDSIRRVAGCCLMEIFRIYAPEPPLDEDEVDASLECIVECLRGLSQGPVSGDEKEGERGDKYTRARIVLDQLVDCQAAVAVADHAVDFDRPDLLMKMYRYILGALHRRQQSAVVQQSLECLSMALHRLEPPQVPHVVAEELLEFACGRKGEERGRMQETAMQVIRQNPQHLRSYVEAVMDKVLGKVDGPASGAGAGGDEEEEEAREGGDDGGARILYGQWEGLQTITRVVAQAAHPLLLYLVPRLGAELRNVDASSRESACLTVSGVFCNSAPAGEQPFAAQFAREFGLLLACVTDRDEHVRVTAVPHVGEIAMQQPALCRRCCHALECALVDESNAVRSAAVSALARVARQNPTMVPSSSVSAMADRLFDKLPAVGVNAADGLGRLYGDALAGLAAGVQEDGSGAVTSLIDIYGTGAAAEAIKASGGSVGFESEGGGSQASMAGDSEEDSDSDEDEDEEEEDEAPRRSKKRGRSRGKSAPKSKEAKGKGGKKKKGPASGAGDSPVPSAQVPSHLAVPALRDSDQALIGKLWWIPDALLRSYTDLSVQGRMRVVQIFDLVLVPAHAPEVEKAFRLLVVAAGLSTKGFNGLVAVLQARQRGQAAVREVVELVRKGYHTATFDEDGDVAAGEDSDEEEDEEDDGESSGKKRGRKGKGKAAGKGKAKGKKGKAAASSSQAWSELSKAAQAAVTKLLAACPHSSDEATNLAKEGLAKVVLSPDRNVIRLLQAACSPMSVPADALKAKKELTDRLKLADAGDVTSGSGSRARRAKGGGKPAEDQTSRFHALRPCLKTCQMLQLGVDVVPYMLRLLRCAADELGEGGGAHAAAVALESSGLCASAAADVWSVRSSWLDDRELVTGDDRTGGFGPGAGAAGESEATAQAEHRMEQGGGSAAAEGIVGSAQASAAAAAASAGDGASSARTEREQALAAARSDASESAHEKGSSALAEAYPWGGPHLAQAVSRGGSLLMRVAKLFPQVLAACHEDLTDLCRTAYPPTALAAARSVGLCAQQLRDRHPIACKGIRQLLLDYACGRDAKAASAATAALLKLFPVAQCGKSAGKLDSSLQRVVDGCKDALESDSLEALAARAEDEEGNPRGDSSAPSPPKSRKKDKGGKRSSKGTQEAVTPGKLGAMAGPRDSIEAYGVALAVLGSLATEAPAVWLSHGLDDLVDTAVIQGVLGAKKKASGGAGSGKAADSRKRPRSALASLGQSEVLAGQQTACGSCSVQAACHSQAIALAASRALGLWNRFAEQQRTASRPGESVTREDTMEAGKAAVMTISSALVTVIYKGGGASSSSGDERASDDRAAVLSACCRSLLELSTNRMFLETMYKVQGTLLSRVDPSIEKDDRVRFAVVAAAIRGLRSGAAPLQALGLLATATALGSGSVRAIGDSTLQVAVQRYRNFHALKQNQLQQQLDARERRGEESGSAGIKAVQQAMLRTRARYQPELAFPLLMHSLCHVEGFPSEVQLATVSSDGPDAVFKLLGTQARALLVLLDALRAGSTTAVAFGFRAVGVLEQCDDALRPNSGRLSVVLAVARLVLGSRVKTVDDSQPLSVPLPLPRVFTRKQPQAGGQSPAIAASLQAVRVLGDADPKALPSAITSSSRRGAPSTPSRKPAGKQRSSSGRRRPATPDTVDRFADAAAGKGSRKSAGGSSVKRPKKKTNKRVKQSKGAKLAAMADAMGSSDEDSEEEEEEEEEVLPSASRRTKGRGSRGGSSAVVESKSPEHGEDSGEDGGEDSLASPPRRDRMRKGKKGEARPGGDSTGKPKPSRRSRRTVRG